MTTDTREQKILKKVTDYLDAIKVLSRDLHCGDMTPEERILTTTNLQDAENELLLMIKDMISNSSSSKSL